MKNIYKRNDEYYFRINIPTQLALYFGNQRLYVKTIGSKNKLEAIKLRNILYNKFQIIKDGITMKLDKKKIKELVDDFKDTKLDDVLDKFNYLTHTSLSHAIDDYKIAMEHEDYTIVNDLSQTIYESLKLEEGAEDDYTNTINISELLIKNIIDKLEDIKNTTNVKTVIHSQQVVNAKKNNEPIQDYVKMYISEYSSQNGWEDSYKDSQVYILNNFQNFFINKDISSFTRSDIVSYRDNYLVKLKKKNNPKEVIAKTRVNAHLTTISSLFKYLLVSDYVSKNICEDIKLKIKDGDEIIRKPYLDSDIVKITDFLNTIGGQYKYDIYNIVKVAQYSGLRVNEIIQLKKKDIKLMHDILVFDINSDDGKKLKNKYSIRLVPIHSNIQSIIEDIIKPLKANDNIFKIQTKSFSMRYGKYNKKLGFGKDKVFHSYRHSFTNKLKQQLVEPTVIDELTGHSHSKSSMSLDRYANKYSLDILKDAVEKVSYQI